MEYQSGYTSGISMKHAWHSIRNIWCSPQRTSEWNANHSYKYKMNANLWFTIIQQWNKLCAGLMLHIEHYPNEWASWAHSFAQFRRFAWIDSWCLLTAHNDYCSWMLCLCFSSLWLGFLQRQSFFVSYRLLLLLRLNDWIVDTFYATAPHCHLHRTIDTVIHNHLTNGKQCFIFFVELKDIRSCAAQCNFIVTFNADGLRRRRRQR